jgi:pyruvate kinase
MSESLRRTTIVATIGPASRSPSVMRQLITAGMDVARLNFSHGSYEDHAQTVANLRAVAAELDRPITLLQDLQGPKVRVGRLPGGKLELVAGAIMSLVPEALADGNPSTIPIDYPHAASEAQVGMQILLADGLFELEVTAVDGPALRCRVVEGGTLSDRKGVNFPSLDLRLPSLTDKDLRDLDFGLAQDVDWVSLSFVRSPQDVRALKDLIAAKGKHQPVMAKIEKPQAVDRLDAIIAEAAGIMVARGDLGVEMSPERVPMIQKRIIEACNRRAVPVITATQMLESMIHDPRPTRAEASDVANAIIDGTDAVMLSGESAVGAHPVKAVEMMARIASEVESRITFRSYPPAAGTIGHALCESVETLAKHADLRCIVAITTTGDTARLVATQRPRIPVVALTAEPHAYHTINLLWGVRPLLVPEIPPDFAGLMALAERALKQHGLAASGDRYLVVAALHPGTPENADVIHLRTME